MLVLVILTMLAAVTTGSGNAPFYAFVEMIPKLAHSSGINPAYLTIPMLQASNLGRTLSPVSGVVVAVAGMAKISPFEVVKRTSVPVLVGLVIVIVATELMVPERQPRSQASNSHAGGKFLRLYHVTHCGICVAVCQLCREQFQQ